VDVAGAQYDKRSRSCDMESEVLEHFEVFQQISIYRDVDGRRLGPFEVRECTVEIVVGLKPLETVPERWSGYEGRTPISTNMCCGD